MKTQSNFRQMIKSTINIKNIGILLAFLLSQLIFAEGTPSASPNSTNITALLIAPDLASGSYLNCNSDNRIYFNINDSTNENLYFGFDFRQYAAGAPTRLTNVYYKIMKPDGTLASSGLWNSTVGSTGSIDSYSNAVVGPNIGATTTGYSPLVFDPTVNGDYWIEFYRSNDGGVTPDTSLNGRAVAPFFDLTVANNSGAYTRHNGRIYSQKWSLLAVTTTYGVLASASSNPILYAYTDDQSIIRVDFQNGFQPIAYNVAINNYGTTPIGTYDESRKSRNDAVAPTLANGYKVFLNIPDSNIYPVAAIPVSPTFQTQAITGNSPFNINYITQEVGDVRILIDLNGTTGYQSGTADVLLEAYNVPIGNNSIAWNGLNGLGVPVTSSINITLSLKLLKGRFNLPLYDVEVNKNGFNVSIVAPVAVSNMQLFWDDSQLTNIGSTCDNTTGANNITGAGLNMSKGGVQSPGHAWNGNGNINQIIPAPAVAGNDTDTFQCNDFGNARTINTWGWGIFSTQTNISVNTNTIAITTPTSLNVCDDNNDGSAAFDLTTKNAEILGALSNSLYSINYYTSLTDSQNNISPIASPTAYISSNATVYVRVWENANPNNFAVTSLNLVVNLSPVVTLNDLTICVGSSGTLTASIANPNNYTFSWMFHGVIIAGANTSTLVVSDFGLYKVIVTDIVTGCTGFANSNILYVPAPTANQAPNLTQVDIPYDGHAVFDLTLNNSIINTAPGFSVSYYPSIADAQNGPNVIATPAAYINLTNPQTIGVRVTNPVTGCYSITSFQLIVTNPDIVYIPDANFKNKLLNASVSNNIALDALGNSIVIDVNNDGEIEYSEALAVSTLNNSVNNNLNLIGIEAFLNLTHLDCSANVFLTNLDVSNLVNLTFLNTELSSDLVNLNLSNLVNLTTLNCKQNHLTTIDLSDLINLSTLNCQQNYLTNLDVSNLVNLTSLTCTLNQLTNLDVSSLVNLITLDFSINQLTSIDLSNQTFLTNLTCNNNSLINLDVSSLVNLNSLICGYNQLTILDCSNNIHLTNLDIAGNLLQELYLKNGSNENANVNSGSWLYAMSNNPNLRFICADENEVADLQDLLVSSGNTSAVVNTYCSFNPGGNYNTINGTVTFDANNNGCDSNDLPQPNIRIDINDGTNSGATFTSNTGNYNFYTQAGSYLLTPSIENPTWFTFSPASATSVFADSNNNTSTQNFCLSPNGIHNDLEVSIMPVTPARPGFDATYKLVLRNKGNQTLNSWTGLFLNYEVTKMSFVSSSITVDSSISGQLGFGYFINPFETLSIEIIFHINSPTDTNPVNIGDILHLNSSIVIANDEFPSDNTLNYAQTVVGSFDPNSIECLEGESVSTSEIGNYLHYAVNFENTGNSEAENVVVKDVIDIDKYDIESLQVMNTSNPTYIKITGNAVEFIFKNIHLAPRGGHPPVGGHGNVLFKIKSKNNLHANDFVEKTAKIYFDYNAPIDTNIAQTTFVSLNNSIPVFDNSVIVFPNPTTGNFNISSNFNIKSIELYDIQGRILETSFENNTTTKLDISEKQNGIYFIKVNTENGSKIEKIVKE